MRVDQFGGFRSVHFPDIVLHHHFDTAQFREETAQHILVGSSSLQIHQMLFASVEDTVAADNIEGGIGIGRTIGLQQVDKAFPVFCL